MIGGKLQRRSARTRGSAQGELPGGRGRRERRLVPASCTPTIAVVTNIDAEHLDHYGTLEQRSSRPSSTSSTRCRSTGWRCCASTPARAGDPAARREAPRHLRLRAAGRLSRASTSRFDGLRTRFTACARGERARRASSCAMPGRAQRAQRAGGARASPTPRHRRSTIYRAGARRASRASGGASPCAARPAASWWSTTTATTRPRSRATLAGARAGFRDRRIVVAFQPHRYTRTRDLLDEFARAFNEADAAWS